VDWEARGSLVLYPGHRLQRLNYLQRASGCTDVLTHPRPSFALERIYKPLLPSLLLSSTTLLFPLFKLIITYTNVLFSPLLQKPKLRQAMCAFQILPGSPDVLFLSSRNSIQNPTCVLLEKPFGSARCPVLASRNAYINLPPPLWFLINHTSFPLFKNSLGSVPMSCSRDQEVKEGS
jgi:hypothetical protein